MIYIFYLVAFSGLLYFSIKKRTPDGFLLAFFSALVYFLPGFFGYVNEPYAPNFREAVEIEAEVYVIYIMVLLGLLASAGIWDHMFKPIKPFPIFSGEKTPVLDGVMMVILLSLLVVVAPSYSDTIFSDDKHIMMRDLPYLHKFFMLYAGLAGILFLIKKRYWLVLLCVAVLAWDIYVGFRSRAAFFVIAAVLVWVYSLGPTRLLSQWRAGAVGLTIAVFFFNYKNVYGDVKRGDYARAIDRFFSLDGLSASVLRSEPFTIQATLNRIVRESFVIPGRVIFDQAVAIFPFSRSMGASVEKFNDKFQQELFPDLTFGMAANWWAYWLAGLGWAGVFLGFAILILGCLFVNILLRSNSLILSAMGAMVASLWLFYIHRNDFLFTFGYVFQTIFLALATLFSVVLFHGLLSANSRPFESRSRREGS
ncbi:hypothetical protein V6X02_04280 [Spiribacter sp. 1M153]|uniref:hypothetical protein n=1 Tax=Spiribacter roseus TaxID=1855875 RepID=UPI00349FCF70